MKTIILILISLIIISITACNSEKTFDEYVEWLEKEVTHFEDRELLLSEELELNGSTGHKIVFLAPAGKYHWKMVQYFFLTEESFYFLQLTCEKDYFDEYFKIGEKIMNSFELKLNAS